MVVVVCGFVLVFLLAVFGVVFPLLRVVGLVFMGVDQGVGGFELCDRILSESKLPNRNFAMDLSLRRISIHSTQIATIRLDLNLDLFPTIYNNRWSWKSCSMISSSSLGTRPAALSCRQMYRAACKRISTGSCLPNSSSAVAANRS